jgi:hypothetical protein
MKNRAPLVRNEPVTVRDVTRRLSGIAELRERCRSVAMLESVLSPEWHYRWFSFDSRWAPGEEMASGRDGPGGEYWIVSARRYVLSGASITNRR